MKYRVWDGAKMWYPPKKEDYTWRIARAGKLWRCTAFYDETIEHNTSGIAMLQYQDGEDVYYVGDVLMARRTEDIILERWEGRRRKDVWSESFELVWDRGSIRAKGERANMPLAKLLKEWKDEGGIEINLLGNVYENPELKGE